MSGKSATSKFVDSCLIDDDDRLSDDFLKLTTIYKLAGILNNDSAVNDNQAEKFLRLLRNIYTGKDGMMKMFIDKLDIEKLQKPKGTLKATQSFDDTSVNFNFTKHVSTDLFKFDLEHIKYGAKIEHEIIKKAIEKRQSKAQVKRFPQKCYVYLLLDPTKFKKNVCESTLSSVKTLLEDVTLKDKTPVNLEKLLEFHKQFVDSIFYVGFGNGPRSMAHFKFARNENKFKYENFGNSKRIREIWNKKGEKGPILLHCIDGIFLEEAQYREAFLIDVLKEYSKELLNNGKRELTSDKTDIGEKRAFVKTFLFKSHMKLVLEGGNQIMRDSIKEVKPRGKGKGKVGGEKGGLSNNVSEHWPGICECDTCFKYDYIHESNYEFDKGNDVFKFDL